MRSSALLIALALAVGCTSGPDAEPEARDAAASPDATESADSAGETAAAPAVEIPLADLEGHWVRDDGRRYVLVYDDMAMVLSGYDQDDDAWGCRVNLSARDEGGYWGVACLVRNVDEDRMLVTEWILQATGADELRGQVEAVDLDDDDHEASRLEEARTFTRVEPLGEEAREGWLALARFHDQLDSTMLTKGLEGLPELFMSPELQALEHVPHNESVVERLQVLGKRVMQAQAKQGFDSMTASADQPGGQSASGADRSASGADGSPSGDQPASGGATARTVSGAPDMDGFMALFDGSSAGVEAAFDAYGVEGLERSEMDWYDLRNPRVVGEDTRDGLSWYRLEADAGITIRVYELGWAGDRVEQVVFVEMR